MSRRDDPEALRLELAELEAQLARKKEALRRLDENEPRAELRARVLAHRRGIALGGGAENSILVVGDGNVIRETPVSGAPPALLRRAYLGDLAAECDRLPLAAVDKAFASGGLLHAVGLEEVYVPLDVIPPASPEDGGETAGGLGLRLPREGGEREPALAVLGSEAGRRCVLLGEAGSGKSVLANELCRALADGDEDFPEALRGLFPARFVLREVAARHLGEESAKGAVFWAALEADVAARLGAPAGARLLEHLQARLIEDGALVILDGLDEVPAEGARREKLRDAVLAFAACLGPRTRVLVTARPHAYRDPSWQLRDYGELTLAPFTAEQVETFVDGWYRRAARRALGWSDDAAAGRGRGLVGAIRERPYLEELAARPLFLTLIAMLDAGGGKLPEDRADLYEEITGLLLSRWQLGKEEADGHQLTAEEPALRQALEQVAYAVHERERYGVAGEEPADIDEGELLKALKPLLRRVDPDALVGYLRDRAGLLVERRPGVFAFPHRSFQEYLAACRLGRAGEPAKALRRVAREDPVWWREVVLLAIGRLKRGGLSNAVERVASLLVAKPEPGKVYDEVDWRLAMLGAQALDELQLRSTLAAEGDEVAPSAKGDGSAGDRLDAEERAFHRQVLDRSRAWLVHLLAEGALDPKARLEAGDLLGRLGDPRAGVATLGWQDRTLPSIVWAEVPKGTFWMGSRDEEKDTYPAERPRHRLALERFWIARYPVTNAQFRPFVEAGGYDDRRFWSDAGWAWRQGAEVDVAAIPKKYREAYAAWLAKRPKAKRDRPFFRHDRRLSSPSRPVIGVTWYEAVAYANWLEAARLDGAPVFGENVSVPEGYAIRLPSEAEWEKAARGTRGRRWPWGGRFRAGDCNSKETELGETSPVGIFPKRGSPFGVDEMVGNTFEWTASQWGGNFDEPDFAYPYDAHDGRETMDDGTCLVVRGGSWNADMSFARCANRDGVIPSFFFYFIGFRLVLSLAISES